VEATRQPRRLAFGRGPVPAGSDLEVRSGPLDRELRELAAEGVQSLLLEGGPTIASAFVAADLVDKVMLFVAPRLSGAGPTWLGELPQPIELIRPLAEAVDDDVLVTAYVHEP
jgi:diaminohydroxyphosphoribosylaminopyrimidine deaminase/5-amino-6-(5-phosphoribosylamino)uracil reductase